MKCNKLDTFTMANMCMLDEKPMSGVTILKACLWLAKAFNTLNNTSTVARCFEKAGFLMPDKQSSSISEADVTAETDANDEALLIAELAASNPESDSNQQIEDFIEEVIQEQED